MAYDVYEKMYQESYSVIALNFQPVGDFRSFRLDRISTISELLCGKKA